MEALRIILHVVAAVVWLAVYVMELGERRSRLATTAGWVAFAVLVVTGMWSAGSGNITSTSVVVQGLLMVKITAAMVSGASGAVVMTARNPKIVRAATITTIVLALVAGLIGAQVAPAI